MFSRRTNGDNRGVAPVIGVVLLIGITVILAATVAAFAFGLEDNSAQGEIPTIAMNFEFGESGSSDEVKVVHASGEIVDVDPLYLTLSGAACSGANDPNGRHEIEGSGAFTAEDEFAAGKPLTIDASAVGCASGSDLDLRGATVRVSWRTGTGSSSTIRTWTGPT